MEKKPQVLFFGCFTERERKRISAMAANVRESYRAKGINAPQGVRALAVFVAERLDIPLEQLRADPMRYYAKVIDDLNPVKKGIAAGKRDLNRFSRKEVSVKQIWGDNYHRLMDRKIITLGAMSKAEKYYADTGR